MASNQPVVLGWTDTKQDRESVYENLVDAVNELREMDPDALGTYHVVWESTGHNHGSTKYEITNFDSMVGEPVIYIRGGRGGEYRIITKSYDYPWIHYLPPNEPDSYGWEEQLTKLAILSSDFEYVNNNGWEAFLDDPFSILRNLY